MIGIITQARLGSTRLPKKIFKEVKGLSLLQHQVNRVSKLNIPLFVATTTEPADELVEKYCKEKGIKVFRGSEQNVLERFYKCAKYFGLSTIIRITSDCPLIAPELIQKGVEMFKANKQDNLYISNIIERTFPRGFDFEIFTFNLLERAYLEATEDYEKEHVTPFIWQHPKKRGTKLMHLKATEDNSRFRITLDTDDDFKLIKKLILEHNADQLSGDEIIRVLKNNLELAKINEHIEQKKLK